MKRHISIFALLLSAFAVVGLSASAADSVRDVMRLTPIGYRLGTTDDVRSYDPSVVTVTPGDTSIVTSNKSVTLTAVPDRDYKVVRWQKFAVDPTVRTEADPIEEFGEKSETVSVDFDGNVAWMYVTVVVKYDPVRTVKTSLSSFARGTVTVRPEKTSYLKGDVLTLTAEPAEGYAFVRWSDGNADHARTVTVDGDIDLKAYIEPISSRVSFSAGAGAVLDVTSKRVSLGNAYGELPVPTHTGARFSGWADADARTVTAKTEVNRIADHTLYAQWGTDLYEIAWDFTGRGNGKVDGAGTYAYGSQPTLKAVPYEGSAFTGWTDGVTLNPRRITVLSNALYVAAFDVATYDVTFTYRDASGKLVTAGPTTVEYGGKVDPPSIPEWPEHTFKTWSTEEYKKVTRDLAVEAIYDAMTYSVAFAYKDWQGNSVTTMPQHVVSGGKANPPDRSVVDNWAGHTFKGWQPDYNVIRADTLCEAIYDDVRCTVKFSYRDKDGNLVAENVTVNYGEAVLETSVPPKSKVDQWPDHEFLGWDERYAEATNCVTDDLTVNARYKDVITVIYSPGKGQGDRREFDLEEEGSYVILNPTNDLDYSLIGYTFDYWQSDDKKNYQPGDKVKLKAGDTLALTASWKPITYTIAFDGNGGECHKKLERGVEYDEQRKLSFVSGDFDHGDKYEFVGLGTNREEVLYAKPSETHFVDWQPVVSNLTTEANATVTLYAIWQGKPQKVFINGEPAELDYGSQLEKPEDPAPKPGYTFTGEWHTNNNVTVSFPITVAGGFDLDPNETANKYKVAFHDNGEDGCAMEPQEFTYDVAQALTRNGFTRTGYTFANWTNEVGTVFADGAQVKNLATNDGAVVDLYATWTMNPRYYAVRFNPKGGEGEAYVQDIECGVETQLTPNRFARKGYGFAGWNDGEDAVARYRDGEKVTDLAAEGETNDLWAVWTPNRYWVKFDGNGADGGTPMEPQEFTYDVAQALTSNAFTKTGYSFDGWKTNETGEAVYANGAVVSNLTAEADATNTLWATWTPNHYAVRFNPGEGTGEAYTQGFTYDQSQKLMDNTFEPPELKSFAGWATNAAGKAVYANGAEIRNLTAEADGTVNLYAVWGDDSYTVDFDGNGKTGGSMDPQVFKHGETGTLTPNAYVRTGFGFKNWTNDSNKVYADGASFKASESGIGETLYAVWTNCAYYCWFDSEKDGPYHYGDKVERSDPTNPGYVFLGWTNETGIVDLKTFTMPDHDVAFGSKWRPIKYTVEFHGTDGSYVTQGTMEPQEFMYDVEQALSSNKFTRTGYEFTQWTNAVGDVFKDGQKIMNRATTDGATVKLYAVWQESGNPLSIALGLDANFDVEVSDEGAWTVIGEPKEKNGLERTSASPGGTLRVTVPSGGRLHLEFDVDSIGGPLTIKFNGETLNSFSDDTKTDYEPESGGVFEFSGTPNDGTTWTLKNFKWTAK